VFAHLLYSQRDDLKDVQELYRLRLLDQERCAPYAAAARAGEAPPLPPEFPEIPLESWPSSLPLTVKRALDAPPPPTTAEDYSGALSAWIAPHQRLSITVQQSILQIVDARVDRIQREVAAGSESIDW
jgi:hypothetical protein